MYFVTRYQLTSEQGAHQRTIRRCGVSCSVGRMGALRISSVIRGRSILIWREATVSMPKTSHTISNQISRACLEILQDQIAFTPITIAGSTEKRCYAGYPIRVIVLPEIQWNKRT